MSENQAQAMLEEYFAGEGEEGASQTQDREVVVLLLDEVDTLVTRAQTVLYRLFEWLLHPHSKLVFVAISNTMDLAERLLPRVASRLGIKRVNFEPYDKMQLKKILAERLKLGKAEGTINEEAIGLCAARVASSSGDARKALQVCRKAAEAQALRAAEEGIDPGAVTVQQLTHIEVKILRCNPCVQAISNLAVKARRLLLAMVLELRSRPTAAALPLKLLKRRYEGLITFAKRREALAAGESITEVADPFAALRHYDDVDFMLKRLESMGLVRTYVPPKSKRASLLGALDAATGTAGWTLADGEHVVELGENLDADDCTNGLCAVEDDDLAKEMLGSC